jgi:hypothetical protein
MVKVPASHGESVTCSTSASSSEISGQTIWMLTLLYKEMLSHVIIMLSIVENKQTASTATLTYIVRLGPKLYGPGLEVPKTGEYPLSRMQCCWRLSVDSEHLIHIIIHTHNHVKHIA